MRHSLSSIIDENVTLAEVELLGPSIAANHA